MALVVAHKNKEKAELEAKALLLWQKVLEPKWDAKAREEADRMFDQGGSRRGRPDKDAGGGRA